MIAAVSLNAKPLKRPMPIVQAKRVIPIVHSSSLLDHISNSELEAIFTLGVARWCSGERIVLVAYRTQTVTQDTFAMEYFGMNPYKFKELVNQKTSNLVIYRPIFVNTEGEMVKEVARAPGRIGFVRSNYDFSSSVDVKPLKVN